MNPILGETYNGEFEDGTKYYAEQSCHRPPVSHFLIYGPNNCYICDGFAEFAAHPGFNSISVNARGSRKIIFSDGTKVLFGNCDVFLIFYINLLGILW